MAADRLGSFLDDAKFVENPDPRCPCVLLLDTSTSMSGAPIAALNEGLQAFERDLKEDALAGRRVEVAIVTFGDGGVRVVQEFVTARGFTAPRLSTGGMTPMGGALRAGLNLLRNEKQKYKENGISYFRPWMLLITDGAPNDEWQSAAGEVRVEEAAGGVAVFPIGVEGADMAMLSQISLARQPVKLNGLGFTEMFVWLSQSQRRVSATRVGDQVPLTPIGWGSV
jgi:uncharacterized protein YegL